MRLSISENGISENSDANESIVLACKLNYLHSLYEYSIRKLPYFDDFINQFTKRQQYVAV